MYMSRIYSHILCDRSFLLRARPPDMSCLAWQPVNNFRYHHHGGGLSVTLPTNIDPLTAIKAMFIKYTVNHTPVASLLGSLS